MTARDVGYVLLLGFLPIFPIFLILLIIEFHLLLTVFADLCSRNVALTLPLCRFMCLWSVRSIKDDCLLDSGRRRCLFSISYLFIDSLLGFPFFSFNTSQLFYPIFWLFILFILFFRLGFRLVMRVWTCSSFIKMLFLFDFELHIRSWLVLVSRFVCLLFHFGTSMFV